MATAVSPFAWQEGVRIQEAKQSLSWHEPSSQLGVASVREPGHGVWQSPAPGPGQGPWGLLKPESVAFMACEAPQAAACSISDLFCSSPRVGNHDHDSLHGEVNVCHHHCWLGML